MQRVNEVCATAHRLIRYSYMYIYAVCMSSGLNKSFAVQCFECSNTVKIPYSRNFFWGRKLSWIGEKDNFHREKFRGLLVFVMPKGATPPSFTEKTFKNSHKTAKFVKVFSFGSHMSPHLMKVLCYSTSNTVLWSKYTTEWCSISKDCNIIIHI